MSGERRVEVNGREREGWSVVVSKVCGGLPLQEPPAKYIEGGLEETGRRGWKLPRRPSRTTKQSGT